MNFVAKNYYSVKKKNPNKQALNLNISHYLHTGLSALRLKEIKIVSKCPRLLSPLKGSQMYNF